MSYECFDVSITDKIAHIVLNRPEAHNTMTRAFWNELPEIVEDISNGAKARCIVISNQGKHFSAGLDLGMFAGDDSVAVDMDEDRHVAAEAWIHDVKKMQRTFSALYDARVPVIMAAHGGIIGGAVDMASACDIRFVTKDAFFCIAEINIGMTADVGTFPRLTRLLPDGLVRELAYTGRRFSAQEALAHGLVNGVFNTQVELVEHAFKVAGEIAARSPLAVAGSKRIINYAHDHTTNDTLDYILTMNAGMLSHAHIMESGQAKAQKRAPVYPDLKPLKKKV